MLWTGCETPATMYPMNTTRKPLTARQQQVLDLWLAGATYRELADRLDISTGTVNPHLKAIARKLGAPGIARGTLRAAYEDASYV